jgi:hypothetical protein
MTAGDSEAQAAREAVQAAQAAVAGYSQATTGQPGVGALMNLPGQAGVSGQQLGPQHGDNYPGSTTPQSALETPRGRPTYAGSEAGGAAYQAQLAGQGADWPETTMPLTAEHELVDPRVNLVD